MVPGVELLLVVALAITFTLIGACLGRRRGRVEGLRAAADVAGRRRVLEVDDTLVQDLAVARYAVQAGLLDDGLRALDDALAAAKRTATAQLDEVVDPGGVRPGDLVRERPC
jgi:hypothetical protein